MNTFIRIKQHKKEKKNNKKNSNIQPSLHQFTTGFVTKHAVTCRLTAESPGSAPAPYARHEYGHLYLYL